MEDHIQKFLLTILFFRKDLITIIKQHLNLPVKMNDIKKPFQTNDFLCFLSNHGIIEQYIEKDSSLQDSLEKNVQNIIDQDNFELLSDYSIQQLLKLRIKTFS